jgi:prepilin-type N-terminal cleavage/methylation domain-containing protein
MRTKEGTVGMTGGALPGRRGFTLIEVLVVLLIASIVLSVLATVLGSTMEILRTGESRSQLNASARNALDYIVSDLSTATDIPRCDDRDLNGYDDGENLPADGGNGYNLQATWRVARLVNSVPVVDSSIFLSEAFSDHLQTEHDNRAWSIGNSLYTQSYSPPKVIASGGSDDAVYYKSFFRLAVPANADFPYYLSQECDRTSPPDGVIGPGELYNTGAFSGDIYGYPETVPVGTHSETAVLIQDLFYRRLDKATNQPEPTVRRVKQMPIASNITRINFAYYHNVPVFTSRVNGAGVQIAYQNLSTGEINWANPDATLNQQAQYNSVPLLDHYELRQIDVAYDRVYTDSTGATYAGMVYSLSDQYPEGYDTRKLAGTNTTTGFHPGLQTWNCSAFYDSDSNGDGANDNAPVDRLAFLTTGQDSTNAPIEGGSAALRPDMNDLMGADYFQFSTNPSGIGDLGDADGIPDGDGVPDDPVPAWWLPYLRAVRVTVTATPRATIDERRSQSGKPGRDGTVLYYRLDSPMPFLDPNRTQPAPDRKRDYIGQGKDLVLTKMIPVNFSYKLNLVSDPVQFRQLWQQTQLGQLQLTAPRRVEWNYDNGATLMSQDPYDPSALIKARDAAEKYFEKSAP